jgi:hypothetical protein
LQRCPSASIPALYECPANNPNDEGDPHLPSEAPAGVRVVPFRTHNRTISETDIVTFVNVVGLHEPSSTWSTSGATCLASTATASRLGR